MANHSSMWDWARLAEIVRHGLAERERQLREEQAVYGLDSLREVEMHPLLHESIREGGLGVWRERAYPSMVGTPGARLGKSARDRCDLVLTPSPDITLADPIEGHREQDWLLGKGTREHTPSLFADLSTPPSPALKPGLREIPPDEAAWIEVKVVAQFAFTHGVPGPNAAYSSELTGSLARDLAKLNHDPLVRHGAVMLVLFTHDERTAEHDVSIALHRCLDRDCRFRSPLAARFPILDRAGNALCTIVIVPT
jgi:hypothetical protein